MTNKRIANEYPWSLPADLDLEDEDILPDSERFIEAWYDAGEPREDA